MEEEQFLSISLDSLSISEPSDPDIVNDERRLKEWIIENHMEELIQSMTITKRKRSLFTEEQEHERSRLELLDQISQVQRQFLQREAPQLVFGNFLTGLLKLMNSEYGFIGEVKIDENNNAFLQVCHNHMAVAAVVAARFST
jgi:hypothetical protein